MISSTLRLFLGLVMVVGLAAGSLAQEIRTTTDPGAPKLTMESMVHDFGTVVSGTPLSFTFKVKNEGTAELQIKNVAPS